MENKRIDTRSLFMLLYRPARSIVPWRPLCGRGGDVVMIAAADEADKRAQTLANGGSVSVMVCPLDVPHDRCERIRARLSNGVFYYPDEDASE